MSDSPYLCIVSYRSRFVFESSGLISDQVRPATFSPLVTQYCFAANNPTPKPRRTFYDKNLFLLSHVEERPMTSLLVGLRILPPSALLLDLVGPTAISPSPLSTGVALVSIIGTGRGG